MNYKGRPMETTTNLKLAEMLKDLAEKAKQRVANKPRLSEYLLPDEPAKTIVIDRTQK